MRQNLIDEAQLLVYPVILGSVKRFFNDGARRLRDLWKLRCIIPASSHFSVSPIGKDCKSSVRSPEC
ncbi:MAG: hypothetical protein JSV81_03430 [Anaerolineales bacterium]|nr:MAG: hypothetical protein JSV81_03430 [Anaerolineales bacterium]